MNGNNNSFNTRNNGFLSNTFAGSTFHTPTPASTPSLPPGKPMEIDATRTAKPRGPLTAEERQRRKDKNLCMYCGGSGHKANVCPNMSDKAKKAYAAKQKAAPKSAKADTGKA
ncbi:hypothetical protein PM082_023257 [Marasmius tenuissimus]|nr:hypothetical protein PM082_023257 [Marasmius tenuissimus]